MGKKKGKATLRKTIAWLHLWPSLVSALFIIFIALTGTIIVYADEIINLANDEVLHVETVGNQKLTFEELLQAFKKEFPNRNPNYANTYKDPSRSVKINSFDREKGLRLIYMNPYTGEVMKDDGTIHFFYTMAHLHAMFNWHGPGEWIVAIFTIVFFIELLAGLYLWWPKKWNKSGRRASFSIRWKAKTKWINYDLHNVVGFYSLVFTLILTTTGLIIAFKPIAHFTINTFGGDADHVWESSLPVSDSTQTALDLFPIVDNYFEQEPWAEVAQVSTYKVNEQGFYMFSLSNMVGLKSRDGNYPVFVNKYSGKNLNPPESALLHENIENTYWSLHMGTWMGQLGKLLTFLGGIIATSLPITGFFIWWNKRKKPSYN